MTEDNRPVEEDPDVTRIRRAYHMAVSNLAELNEQRAMLTDALNTALFLLDQLLTEMRLANVTPSAGVIVSKADLDRAIRKLLGRDRPKTTQDL